jgi:hypothetical protein
MQACRSRSFTLAVLLLCAPAAAPEDWPQFRGAHQGVSLETGLPLQWTAGSGVAWKTTLPGPGHSSPIVWGDRIFLTAFEPKGALDNLIWWRSGRLLVLSLDRASGRILWQREVPVERIEELHSTNAPASPTPVTDGQRVYVHFGSVGLLAFDFEGRKLWQKPIGPFPNDWGSASSPILYGDLLLLNCDTDAEDFLLAVDKASGQTVWKTPRSDVARSWATPLVWSGNGSDQIVISGSGRVKGYDTRDGRELWVVDGLTTWVTPTPVAAHGLLFVASNGPGGNVVMAIKPGGHGNVTTSHVAWRYDRSAPYSSSPLVLGDNLYVVKNGGVMTCLDARSGREIWQERLAARGAYYASLVGGDGRVYALSEEGEATVLEGGSHFKVAGTGMLRERTMATPAISGGRLYIRSDSTLFAIGR